MWCTAGVRPEATAQPTTPDPPPSINAPPAFAKPAGTKTGQQSGIFTYGITGGLGVDVTVLPNVFMRAEWEYTSFASVHDIKVTINTARVGIGVRF